MLRRATNLIFLACLLLFRAPLAGAEAPSTDFRVVLKDERGEPVAGAEVYVLQCTPQAVDSAGPFKTDATGEARVKGLPGRPTFDQFIYARLPGKLVGAAHRYHWPGESKPVDDPFALTMFESRELRGTVAVPDGFKIQDVTLRLLGFIGEDDHGDPPGGPTLYYMEEWRDWLPKVFECHPNADGTFVLPDTPVRANRYVGAAARGLGEEQWSDRAVKSGEALPEPSLELREEAVIEGTASYDGPDSKPAAGLVIIARSYDRMEVVRQHKAVSDKDGRFRITGLPGRGNKFELICQSFPDGWTSPGIKGLVTNSGAVTGGVDVKLERGALIRGRVLDTEDNPVAGAHVAASNPPHGPVIGISKSEPEGSFTLRVPGGVSNLYFSGYPENYAPIRDDHADEMKISATSGEDREGVTMRLRKVAPSKGERDESKKGL